MECVAHVIQTLTDVDPEATVFCVDGVGAFDLISRAAMLEGCGEGGDSVLPFVSQFYSSASTYVCESGVTHEIIQGEGGEQDASSVRGGPAQSSGPIRDRLLPHEHLLAFLDDIYIVEWVGRQHSHPVEGAVVAPRPDSDTPRENSGLELGRGGAYEYRRVAVRSPHCGS